MRSISAISQNVIRSNTALGIDLSASFSHDGVTVNDALDVDTGANNLQNSPLLATATGDGVNAATPCTFNSEPNQKSDVRAHHHPHGSR